MTTTQTRSPTPLRNALYEFALAKAQPDAELLDEFVRRYPEHASALTDFAIELAAPAPDPACYALAKYFLEEPIIPKSSVQTQEDIQSLAAAIRVAIENWFFPNGW